MLAVLISDGHFKDLVDSVGQVIDLAGIAVVVIGLAAACTLYAGSGRRRQAEDPYRAFRQRVGKAILLGLEFLVAADIIRTVSIAPSFRGVGVLAVIVAVRTFLSFTLEVELQGRWPWQRDPAPPAAGTSSG